jgi:hypothetical protein
MRDRVMELASSIYDSIIGSPEDDPAVVISAVSLIMSTLVVELEIPEEKAIEAFKESIQSTRAMVGSFGWDWPHSSGEVH